LKTPGIQGFLADFGPLFFWPFFSRMDLFWYWIGIFMEGKFSQLASCGVFCDFLALG